MISTLERLERWYAARCDDQWEHQYGIKIDTLDNPGWSVAIDLQGTPQEIARFTSVRHHHSDTNWIDCVVEGGTFLGRGGTGNLHDILEVFLEWAER